MKHSLGPVLLCLPFALVGCGSSSDTDADPGTPSDPTPSEPDVTAAAFDPPPPPEGYERIVAPVMAGLEPGSDVTYCQYVRGPADRDVDVLDIRGFQSTGGHHAVAYATTVEAPLDYSGPCRDEDNLAGGFLGGVGGEAGGGANLPEGVAFRLPAGSSIMLNTHFLNTTNDTLDGQSVLDVKFAEVDPNRQIAAMFVNGNFSFEIPPGAASTAVAECEVPVDMELLMYANHMHDYGSHVLTDVLRGGAGEPELLHDDPEWSYEMQFNAVFTRWDIDAPLVLQAGDVVRTHCNWENGTDEAVTFPREMCIGIGFFLSDGSTSPICANGTWRDDIATTGQ